MAINYEQAEEKLHEWTDSPAFGIMPERLRRPCGERLIDMVRARLTSRGGR